MEYGLVPRKLFQSSYSFHHFDPFSSCKQLKKVVTLSNMMFCSTVVPQIKNTNWPLRMLPFAVLEPSVLEPSALGLLAPVPAGPVPAAGHILHVLGPVAPAPSVSSVPVPLVRPRSPLLMHEAYLPRMAEIHRRIQGMLVKLLTLPTS